jgi:amino acid transporter
MPSSDKPASFKIHQLGWILVFAVVYADIGTSVFYVPGILYLGIGNLATLAQLITLGVFISIALKYVEICRRCPDGGGVVSITREAFSNLTFLPLMGGAFITVDYFLTSSISGVSGLFYLASLYPPAKIWVVPGSILLFLILMIINLIGIRESASLTSTFAGFEILVMIGLLGSCLWWITGHHAWLPILSQVFHPGVDLTVPVLLTGYASTWLAYSGLESAAQISGAMKEPVGKTAWKAMWVVIIVVAVFSPTITASALYIVPDKVKIADNESLLSILGLMTGGPFLEWAVVLAATTLLLMACNTAIAGNYHVNVRLADLGFMPAFLRKRHPRLGTPYWSIIISAVVPMAIILVAQGSVETLGDLYNFGLLGTLTISSIAVDSLRWRDGDRGFRFWFGVFTSFALVAAWLINMVNKPHALLFGGSLAAILILVGMSHRIKADKRAEEDFAEAESTVADLPEASNILTLEEAQDASAIESSPVLVALRQVNTKLLEEAAIHTKGYKRNNVYLVYVDEIPGLFVPTEVKPSPEAQRVLSGSCAELEKHHILGIPIWRMAEDAGTSIADAARVLGVRTVIVGSSKRSFFWRMIKGRLIRRLASRLPESSNLFIVG